MRIVLTWLLVLMGVIGSGLWSVERGSSSVRIADGGTGLPPPPTPISR